MLPNVLLNLDFSASDGGGVPAATTRQMSFLLLGVGLIGVLCGLA